MAKHPRRPSRIRIETGEEMAHLYFLPRLVARDGSGCRVCGQRFGDCATVRVPNGRDVGEELDAQATYSGHETASTLGGIWSHGSRRIPEESDAGPSLSVLLPDGRLQFLNRSRRDVA